MIPYFKSAAARLLLGCGLAAASAISLAQAHESGTPGKKSNGPDTILYSFAGGPSDGAFPVATLMAGASGGFYGTAEYGGANDLGAVFALAPNGAESVLYSFAGGASDGAYPSSNLIGDGLGDLYGTTIEGGPGQCSEDGCGTVFEISSSGAESVIYSFGGLADGAGPQAGLVQDQAGNLYGTTYAGGLSPVGSSNCEGGCGTVFELSPANGSWTETVLYSFEAGKDGANPLGGLVIDSAGNLYGTTSIGGGSLICQPGCGTVFEVSPSGNGNWTEKVIYAFKGVNNGSYPSSTLYLSPQGDLYGTAPEGGSTKCGGGCGVVFKLTPQKNGAWSETKALGFASGAKGAFPVGVLAADAKGNIYGTTEGSGLYNCGVAFQLSTAGVETPLHSFTGTPSDGCSPYGGLIAGQSGQLYGTTAVGGATNNGVIFQVAE